MFEVSVTDDRTDGGLRTVTFRTCGMVCSRQIMVTLESDTVRSVRFLGGCHGNTQGVGALCAGMKAKDVVSRLQGIDCKGRGTSCPDQLARALSMINVK